MAFKIEKSLIIKFNDLVDEYLNLYFNFGGFILSSFKAIDNLLNEKNWI